MKAKTLKKGLGIALSMAMTMSLFGCGSGDSTKEQAAVYFRNFGGCVKRF